MARTRRSNNSDDDEPKVTDLVDEDYPEDNETAVNAIVGDLVDNDEDAAEILHGEVVDGYPDIATDGKVSKSVRRIQREASTKEKQRIGLQLRLAGLTYAQIAERMGYADQSSARAVVNQAMDTYTFGEVRDLRNLVLARLEHLLTLNWPDAMRKDPQATAIVMGLTDRMTKLMGLDAPEKFEEGQVETEGVLTIGGDKDNYIEGLKKARRQLKERND